jgi:tetratricopeptide (TPR) repeat protein
MLGVMRVRIVHLASLALVLLHIPLPAQTSAPNRIDDAIKDRIDAGINDPIAQAERLREDGQAKAAIAILEPLTQADGKAFAADQLGLAWNVLGSSYQDLGMFAKAGQCYETAIEKLRGIPTSQAKYAAAIANLASLEGSMGQRDSAKALFEKSIGIYESLGNSAGITVTSTDLAMISYSGRDFKSAHRYLDRALLQAQRTTGLRDDDIAAIYSTKSALAFHDGRYEEAISNIQQAIDRWTHAHGAAYSMLGLGFALRAQAIMKTGDYRRAIADAQHALAIQEAATGRNNATYFGIEIIYAEILRASGAKEEAARLKKEAGSSLADFESRQCSGCTINVSGFR